MVSIIVRSDESMEKELEEKSALLNISVDDLIDRYIRREMYREDFYVSPKRTLEELLEISRQEAEKDKKKGIYAKERTLDFFVGLNDKC